VRPAGGRISFSGQCFRGGQVQSPLPRSPRGRCGARPPCWKDRPGREVRRGGRGRTGMVRRRPSRSRPAGPTSPRSSGRWTSPGRSLSPQSIDLRVRPASAMRIRPCGLQVSGLDVEMGVRRVVITTRPEAVSAGR
jgi:hypothetical protein